MKVYAAVDAAITVSSSISTVTGGAWQSWRYQGVHVPGTTNSRVYPSLPSAGCPSLPEGGETFHENH